MASLIQELITTLEEEKNLYEELIPVSENKTIAIIKNDLDNLQLITDKEQILVDKVGNLEKKRIEVVENIAIVLNKDVNTLNITSIIEILHQQPEEQKKLSELHDKIKIIMKRLVDVNVQNKSLIQESLEMIEFNMNFIRSTRMSSGSSNYNRNASATDAFDSQIGTFDAKQ